MPMAPEETRMISCPAFFASLSTLQRVSTWRIFRCPEGCVSVDVPTLTVIRMRIPSSVQILAVYYKNTAASSLGGSIA